MNYHTDVELIGLDDVQFSNAEPPPEDDVTALVRELNQKYAVVNEGGKAVIFKFGRDPLLKRSKIDRMSKDDFNMIYMNDKVRVGTDNDGAPIYKTKSALWLNHKDRRQYIEGVTFDPADARHQEGVLNLWKGFAIQPVPGEWSIMKDHIFTNLCNGDPIKRDFLMGWMARLMQFPAEQGEVAVVMKSGEGTGKGTLAKALLTIIGQHGLAISNAKHLVSNFNGHLRDAIFLFADEAFFAGDKAHVGVLKSIITEPYLTVEAKFQNAAQMPNFLHIMMASNEEWVIPASVDARRFFVLDVAEHCKNNHEYFGLMKEQMEAGGYAAMLHDLLAYDLSRFNVRDVPKTAGLQQQQKLSLGIPDMWWKDCLERGYVFKSKIGLEKHLSQWFSLISTELLFASYTEFAKERRERNPMSRESLGSFMVKKGYQRNRFSKDGVVGEHITDEPNSFGGMSRVARPIEKPRPHGYLLGALAEARAAFCEQTSLKINWSDDDANA